MELLSEIFRMISPALGSMLVNKDTAEPFHDYEVMANITYNQRTVSGLRSHVISAQQQVADGIINLDSPDLTRKFLKQSPKTVAANLCNTINRLMNSDPERSFPEFYTHGVRTNCYKWTGLVGKKRLAWLLKPEVLMRGYKIHDNFTNSQPLAATFEILEAAQPKTALVRNRRNTHTYLIFLRDGEYYCADTWHSNWTGKRFADRIGKKPPRWVYWYTEVQR